MLKSKTLFIVGAGASYEVGLPLGKDLQKNIANLVNIKFEEMGRKRASGDGCIFAAIDEHCLLPNRQRGDVNPYLKAGWHINEAMPSAPSIDNFVNNHSHDPQVEFVSKLGIAKSIIDAEKRSTKLRFERRNNNSPFDFSHIEDTWYSNMFKILSTNLTKSNLDNIFEDISFITFNYDRCIEQYLYHVLQSYFKPEPEHLLNVMSKLNIVHPYGYLGKLPWQMSNRSLPFGEDISSQQLLQASSQIKTFTEQLEDNSLIENMEKMIVEAETIVFLGFGYHVPNMKLLNSARKSKVRQIIGTAYNEPEESVEVFEERIHENLNIDTSKTKIVLKNLECKNILNDYRLRLER